MFTLFDEGSEIKNPILTKEILKKLSKKQNKMLNEGRMLINPMTGDTIVPIRVNQNQIAKIIVNIY
tara:strand:+ start:511 stop:708 length:198 start_codon:yes stop_codon:yes gene_type:complete